MKRKILSAFLCVSMAILMLTGCGSAPAVEENTADSTAESTAVAEEAKEPEEETAPEPEAPASSEKADKIRQILKDTEFYDLADTEA